MLVRSVSAQILNWSYDGRFRNPHMMWNGKSAVLVFVTADDGTVGVGEAFCGGPAEIVAAMIDRDLGPRIHGLSVFEPERVWQTMMAPLTLSGCGGVAHAAASGIDIALWDLAGKAAGKPIHQLLGGFQRSVPVYGSGGMYGEAYSPAALGRDMADAVRSGMGGVKIKVAGASLAEDVARVAEVRAAIGPAARLIADAMFVPTVPEAMQLARALAPFDLYFLEAPTAITDRRGWQRIAAAAPMPVAGTELQYGIDTFRDLLAEVEIGFLQIDVTLCGGLTEARKIAALAGAFHRPLSLHCSGTGIALAASAQFGAGLPGCDSVELHLMHQMLFDRLWRGAYRVEDGGLHLPDRPGLGIDLAPSEFNQIAD